MFWWRREFGRFGVAFTDTAAGNLSLYVGADEAAAAANRNRLAAAVAVPAGTLQFMHQIHSAAAFEVHPRSARESAQPAVPEPDADALVSAAGRVPLAVLAADCMPIVLAGTDQPAAGGSVVSTAVVHAGRRGLLAGVIAEAVAKMRALGPQEITAWVGPSICGNCYEVPEAMAAEASAILPATTSRTRWGSAAIDLRAGAAAQLEDLGVQHHLIGACTLEEDQLFSYRRERSAGRFAGLIWRTEEQPA